jgi:triosephosphate isomerase
MFTRYSPFEIILAYEPVWAIGTGKAAGPQVALEAHQVCLDFLTRKWGPLAAKKACLLYGGSVTGETVKALLEQPVIHGVLVGGASLDVDKFVAILDLFRN